ncbi:RNA polymerase sigma factor [uncultured Sulfitobacter sp.]|uniref:RNA polymerase sigma factor n=1 Tax=uncultured Sulfitobacter sp. TaxID=191468 RepID=UPI0026247BAD|nr:RNA polymerase sigma factor [uncultured Sulfitobacter sp.]
MPFASRPYRQARRAADQGLSHARPAAEKGHLGGIGGIPPLVEAAKHVMLMENNHRQDSDMTIMDDDTDLSALANRLRRRAQRLGAQPSDAEDIAQETLLRLMQRMARQDVEAPEHYAMIILQNLIRAGWRARVEMAELEEDSASTLPVGDGRLAVADLRTAIAALPDEQAEVMTLVLQGEFSPRTIAAQLGLPVGTVMSRLARARARLRVQIGLEAGTPVAELL